MAKKRSIQQLKQQAILFASCKNLDDLQAKLHFSKNKMIMLGLHPKYYHFDLRKNSGGIRKIEAPNIELKEIQRKLNYYLQAVYYQNQSSSSYGYIITPNNIKSKKNIVGNAEKHLYCNYLLNLDFKDFFHQIKQEDIFRIFSGNLFSFDNKTAKQLAKLCSYKNYLPMGAPTSPVLSNIYTISLDNELDRWSKNEQLKYSRFVDDLTFSSTDIQITQNHLQQINTICEKYHLKFNKKKTRFLKPKDEKIITGLLLSKTVDIHPDFYTNLNRDLRRLHKICEASAITNNLEDNKLLKKFKQEVYGQINFIGTVEGYQSKLFRDYKRKYKRALIVSLDVLSKRWVNFSYH